MIGYVAIGRNEGERLKTCLASIARTGDRIVYVDSDSGDDSIAAAEAAGAVVVALKDGPLSAARSRNEGYRALVARWPDTAYIMFVDGDCELAPDFPRAALEAFADNPNAGVVAGRVRERARDASVYNLVCDMEWAGPVGEIDACGGIFMARREAFESAGGFNDAVVAAEDDEFCIRTRGAGWKVLRIADDMCFHDAAITRFGQWWKRSVRAGHAFALLGTLHKGYFAPERRRALVWGLVLPAAILIAAPFTGGWSLLGLLLYPVSWFRTRMNLIRGGASARDAGVYSTFLVLSKFPNLLGILNFWRKRLAGKQIGILEYK